MICLVKPTWSNLDLTTWFQLNSWDLLSSFSNDYEGGGEKRPALSLFEFRQGSQAVTQKLSKMSIVMITCQTLILAIMNWMATYWIPPSYQALWSLLSQEPWKGLGCDQYLWQTKEKKIKKHLKLDYLFPIFYNKIYCHVFVFNHSKIYIF